ncbi:MAG: tRNA pseudouridine(13) synthase TruD [Desulfuromonadales bacterium]|nr:tRNA pseudouridine(13) synthase TruD [Desulfuromonadales bacterium]NIR33909.1 tRNA pseudouridine(13) synthase TruD [Desulfuromonadales bacterium]NIS40094.1 tRNA pseudouridine(13) synthase TruD [Desulfuromonadales bacterium]
MTDYLTRSLPGTGGIFKESAEDFRVEEIPLYLPCGEGEHLYLDVEKTGLTTHDLVRRLARALNVRERDIGYAGLKDARATTRQFVSVPGVTAEQAAGVRIDGVQILSARLHGNKLRLGHLAGNRFAIRLRHCQPQAAERAQAILEILGRKGAPNFFGEQRYGALGNSHLIGRAMLSGDYATAVRTIIGDPEKIRNERWREAAERYRAGEPDKALACLPGRMRTERSLLHALLDGKDHRQAVLRLPRKMLRLYLSACQSFLFDRLVAARLDELGTLRAGDLAIKHENGACFLVEDPAKEQERADLFEISPTAPLFGYKIRLAEGPVGETERALLAAESIDADNFDVGRGLSMPGERRAMRVPLSDYSASAENDALLVRFALPRGSYATSVLREIVKDVPANKPEGAADGESRAPLCAGA